MSVRHILATVHYGSETGGIPAYLTGLWEPLVGDSNEPDTAGAQFELCYHPALLGKNGVTRHLAAWFWALLLLWRSRLSRKAAIHCGQVFAVGFAATILRTFWGNPTIVYVYGSEINVCRDRPFRRRILQWILSKSTLVVTISRYTQNLLLSFGCPPEKILLLTPGIPVLEEPAADRVNSWEKRLGTEGNRILLSVSLLVKRKGHLTVLRALPLLVEKHPGLIYLIAGNGPFRPLLEQTVKDLDLTNHVLFTGKISREDLNALYVLADIFVLVPEEDRRTRDIEGFGIVYLEANRFAKPVLASDSGGIPDAVNHNQSGLLIPPGIVEETGKALDRLLSDPTLREKLGLTGQERALREFQWQDRTKALLERL